MKISLKKYATALCDSLMDEMDEKDSAKMIEKIQNVLRILHRRKQNKLIKQLPDAFKSIWLKKHNRMEVTVVLPAEPSKEEFNNILKLLTGTFEKGIILSARVNPDLIGGMKLIFEDSIIDGTVAASLVGLKQHLTVA